MSRVHAASHGLAAARRLARRPPPRLPPHRCLGAPVRVLQYGPDGAAPSPTAGYDDDPEAVVKAAAKAAAGQREWAADSTGRLVDQRCEAQPADALSKLRAAMPGNSLRPDVVALAATRSATAYVLPRGYPETVGPGYTGYVQYQLVANVSSSAGGVLSMTVSGGNGVGGWRRWWPPPLGQATGRAACSQVVGWLNLLSYLSTISRF